MCSINLGQGGFENLVSRLLDEHFRTSKNSIYVIWTKTGPSLVDTTYVKPDMKVIFRCGETQFRKGLTSKQWELIGSVCKQYANSKKGGD